MPFSIRVLEKHIPYIFYMTPVDLSFITDDGNYKRGYNIYIYTL